MMEKVTLQDIVAMADKAKLNLSVDLQKLDPNVKLLDQGMDSLDYANLLFEIEDAFKIEIPDEEYDVGKWDTIEKILENINDGRGQ